MLKCSVKGEHLLGNAARGPAFGEGLFARNLMTPAARLVMTAATTCHPGLHSTPNQLQKGDFARSFSLQKNWLGNNSRGIFRVDSRVWFRGKKK